MKLINSMDTIKINCNECNVDVDKYPNAISIDFNYDVIKNIINSNCFTNIYFCDHKTNELENITTEIHVLSSGLKYIRITNKNYLETYNRFMVIEDKEILRISLLNDGGIENEKEISIEEFTSTIKKGSIIHFLGNSVPLQKLEKILLEHNLDFILKKIEYWCIFIVDTPNYTKSAIKYGYNDN